MACRNQQVHFYCHYKVMEGDRSIPPSWIINSIAYTSSDISLVPNVCYNGASQELTVVAVNGIETIQCYYQVFNSTHQPCNRTSTVGELTLYPPGKK